MLIEALKPLKLLFPEGDIYLEPGTPVDLPNHQAKKVLKKVPEKVKVVTPDAPTFHLGDSVAVNHANGMTEIGEVQAITHVKPPYLLTGWWFWVAVGREGWFHEAFVRPVPQAGEDEKP